MTSIDNRATYGAIKTWVLETYFNGCRDNALMKNWPHEQIIGYVSYQFENAFDSDVESLMWHVVLLILSGGWQEEMALNIRCGIEDVISRHGLDNLLQNIPIDEAEEFMHDLKIIKVI